MDLDLGKVEKAEASIDQFIDKREREKADANATEVAYAESVRRFHQARRQRNAKAWYDYHDHQLRCHEATYTALRARHLAERDREPPPPLKGSPPPRRMVGRKVVSRSNGGGG